MHDRISQYRVARLSLFPPQSGPGNARWALTASLIKGGIPTAHILGDGVLRDWSTQPTTEEVLMGLDAAVRSMMLNP